MQEDQSYKAYVRFNNIVSLTLKYHPQIHHVTLFVCIVSTDSPRDLIDEILVQMHKQQESPEANPVLTQLSESHLNQIIGDVFFGE